MSAEHPNVVIIGGGGYIGYECLKRLSSERSGLGRIVCADVREIPAEHRFEGVDYEIADVRSSDFAALFKKYEADSVVNLASIVMPGKDRSFEYAVDVTGAQRVLDACVEAGVRQLVYTSSGAAYGYYADNPEWLSEDDPLRGNKEFSYSDHKRIVEDMLADYRKKHPELKQLIFRPGTVLGEKTDNRITNLFHRKVLAGVTGTDTPFVFIWDQDVADALEKGVREQAEGIYNLVGDGVVTFPKIAELTGAKFVPLPAALLRIIIGIGSALGLMDYGPEQVMFLQYRPCMSNKRLKEQFGFTPQKNSLEAFEFYLEHARKRHTA
ncbi:MAG: NAD-dependent epimerase/dehydratase family protein [Candidatus Hydrogenedens sp.]|nr:NAD-dependent epimerase/dehydratase family protein [Candidatus Hydrogenedens sp.]